MLENFPSIVPEVHNKNPALAEIEKKLDGLSYKADEILRAVQDCCDNGGGQDEQGEKFESVRSYK